MVRVEPGVFGSLVRALPTELLGNILTMEYLINVNMLYGLSETFFIEFHRNSQQAFAYIIFFILSGD